MGHKSTKEQLPENTFLRPEMIIIHHLLKQVVQQSTLQFGKPPSVQIVGKFTVLATGPPGTITVRIG